MPPKITLYYMPESPPCRAVQMLASMIDVDLTLKILDLSAGEHLEGVIPELNPCKTVPTIVDETDEEPFVLYESRAIMTYLVDRYGQRCDNKDPKIGSTLYPKKIKTRALIDQLLFYDIGNLYSRQQNCLGLLLLGKSVDTLLQMEYNESLDVLDGMLKGKNFLVGSDITIADISIRAGLTFAEACHYDFSPWPNIETWMNRVSQSVKKYSEINAEAMKRFSEYINNKVIETCFIKQH
jgi:glutathione S-transferase